MKIIPSPHRTYPAYTKPWLYYQEWNKVLFLHYQVPYEVLKSAVPNSLILDDFNGTYWVSLVAFTMNQVKPRFCPSFPLISDFHEVNLRTYVKNQNQSGVYFLSIEGEKTLSNFIAKKVSGLPYEKSLITREASKYSSSNSVNNTSLNTDFIVKDELNKKDDLDIWLTERYCLLLHEKGNQYCYQIDHAEWQTNQVNITNLEVNYLIGQYPLHASPQRVHYSPGVKVIAWSREKIK